VKQHECCGSQAAIGNQYGKETRYVIPESYQQESDGKQSVPGYPELGAIKLPAVLQPEQNHYRGKHYTGNARDGYYCSYIEHWAIFLRTSRIKVLPE
jgi:hypothetical protein